MMIIGISTIHLLKKKKQKIRRNEAPGFRVSKEFRRIMWIIIIVVFISVILIYITKSNIHLFKSSSQKIKIENESEIGENIYTINYEKELQAATANRNFRLAVRLLYLQIIKKLADKNLIDFKPHKTNSDYLTQLSSSHLYKDFSRLTRSFEYIWYGGFQMSEEAFTGVQNDFFQFKNKLN